MRLLLRPLAVATSRPSPLAAPQLEPPPQPLAAAISWGVAGPGGRTADPRHWWAIVWKPYPSLVALPERLPLLAGDLSLVAGANG